MSLEDGGLADGEFKEAARAKRGPLVGSNDNAASRPPAGPSVPGCGVLSRDHAETTPARLGSFRTPDSIHLAMDAGEQHYSRRHATSAAR